MQQVPRVLSIECTSRAQNFSVERKKNSNNNRTKSDVFKLTSNCLCDAHYYFVFFLENEYFESAFSGRSHFAIYVSTVPYHQSLISYRYHYNEHGRPLDKFSRNKKDYCI